MAGLKTTGVIETPKGPTNSKSEKAHLNNEETLEAIVGNVDRGFPQSGYTDAPLVRGDDRDRNRSCNSGGEEEGIPTAGALA